MTREFTQAPATSKGPVLLVEDSAANILVATLFLESFGYSAEIAMNGAEAIEKVRNNRYIAVLMDVQMPGMDGCEATRLIRACERQSARARTYIIGMTADALIGDRERCISAGMDNYISKPFNPDMLEEMLSRSSLQTPLHT